MSDPARTPSELLEDLLHGSSDAQAAAAEALEGWGPSAGAALCTSLHEVQAASRALHLQLDHLEYAKSGDPGWRRQEAARIRREIEQNEERVCRLARVLHAVGDREALQPLFEALRRSNSREAHALARALAPLGAPAIPLLDEALESRLLWVAMNAAEALVTIGGPEVAALLVHRLETAAHDLLRACLIRCLGRLGEPAAVEILATLLASGSREERPLAAEALGRIGHPAAVGPLLRCLAHGDDAEFTDLTLHAAALRALGGIPDPRGVPLLVKALQGPKTQLHEPAMEALGRLVEQRPMVELRAALPVLRQRLRHPLGERESVVRACSALVDRIETATAPFKSLPLPAEGGSSQTEQLPRPADPPALEPDQLPIPQAAAEVRPPTGGGRRGPARWLQRWRHRP